MAQNILKAIGGMPLVRLQRSAVRYRLRVTEPGDAAAHKDDVHGASNDDALHHRLAASDVCCELRP